MDWIQAYWRNVDGLRTLSAWLTWSSIALVFAGGALQVGRYIVDRREKALTATQAHPLNQPIRTASATLEVIIRSDQEINTHYMDQGGYLAFGRENEAIQIVNAADCLANQLGGNRVRYRGVFNLDVNDPSVGKAIKSLGEAQFVQMFFHPMPKHSEVLEGKAVLTVNSSVQIGFAVPVQTSDDNGYLFVREMTPIKHQLTVPDS